MVVISYSLEEMANVLKHYRVSYFDTEGDLPRVYLNSSGQQHDTVR